MGSLDSERAQVMILRAWVEADSEHSLRVRVTNIAQNCAEEPVIRAVTTIDGACVLVRGWLEELLGDTGHS
jgi:hypothetical protein